MINKVTIALSFWLMTFSVFTDDLSEWIINTKSKENYNGVTLANGRIGLVSGAELFSVSDIVLNGVYDKESEGGVSRIVRGPLFTNLRLNIDGVQISDSKISEWQQSLNMKHSYLKTTIMYQGTKISYTLRTLRNLPYMALGVVEITPQKDIDIEVENEVLFPSELQSAQVKFKNLRDGSLKSPINTSKAVSLTGMQELATSSVFLFDTNDVEVKEKKGNKHSAMYFKCKLVANKTYRFALIGAICTSRDFVDPKGESERMVVYALRHNIEYFIEGHEKAWGKLWESDIIIEGCPEDQKDVRLALYNLYSFQRKGSRLSIPPMGLSTTTGYNGHVFWDSELWMYPPVLLLNQDLARAHIDYRTDRLPQAIRRAEQYGYEGAMYPWESDDSGEESTPTWCLTGTFEQHITADIAIAFWNYYRVTNNIEWLKKEGYKVIKNTADFWASRVTWNKDGSCSINKVVGADENASIVDDNAFTNGSVKVALMNAIKATEELGLKPCEKWKNVADNLRFNYMPDGTMLEHSKYNGETIKQADVNLLAYPLGLISTPDEVKRNLKYYEEKIIDNGPAMGFSILSILHARFGNRKKAYELFKRSYIPNKRPPFGVLSESSSSNNPYFATGGGGMLQAVLFGFAGLEITDDGIQQRTPLLPEKWKSLTIKGVGLDKKIIVVK